MPIRDIPDPLSEVHESRIQRLETSVTDLVAHTAEHSANLRHLEQKIDQHQEQLVAKLDSVVSSIVERLDSGQARFDKIETKQTKYEAAVLDLKSDKRLRDIKRAQRTETLKKVGVGAVLAVSGASLHQLGKTIMSILGWGR